MMRMCMMIFYTFKEMNNVVCVGTFSCSYIRKIRIDKISRIVSEKDEILNKMVAFLDYPHRWR